MFINSKAEAKLASRIARQFGFEVLSEAKFYKRYTTNVFSPWSSENDARRAIAAIADALRERRNAR